MGYWNNNNSYGNNCNGNCCNSNGYNGNNNYGGNCGQAHAPNSYTKGDNGSEHHFQWYTKEHYENEIEPWL